MESSDPLGKMDVEPLSQHPSNPFESSIRRAPRDHDENPSSVDPTLLVGTPHKRQTLTVEAPEETFEEDQTMQTHEEEEVEEVDAEEETVDLDEDMTLINNDVEDGDDPESDPGDQDIKEDEEEPEYESSEDEDPNRPIEPHELSEGDFVERSSDDQLSLELKPEIEKREILEEIADLEAKVPQLTDDYELVDRLGTGQFVQTRFFTTNLFVFQKGTFSAVYKAVDLNYHEKWDNAVWHGRNPPNTSAHYQTCPRPSGKTHFVAVKRILVTSAPKRVMNELVIMELCRGCRHVAQIITAFRHEDQVLAIMPYQRSLDFKASQLSGLGVKLTCKQQYRITTGLSRSRAFGSTSDVCSGACETFMPEELYTATSSLPISYSILTPWRELCLISDLQR